MRALCLILYLLLSIHWVACLYYTISEVRFNFLYFFLNSLTIQNFVDALLYCSVWESVIVYQSRELLRPYWYQFKNVSNSNPIVLQHEGFGLNTWVFPLYPEGDYNNQFYRYKSTSHRDWPFHLMLWSLPFLSHLTLILQHLMIFSWSLPLYKSTHPQKVYSVFLLGLFDSYNYWWPWAARDHAGE